MTIDNDVRRLAQTGLVAAIDGSYALGFIFALGQTVVRPGSGVKSFAKKLARRFVRHWWKHTKQRDLEDVQIYDAVKNSIANALKDRLGQMLQGVALKPGGPLFYATVNKPLFAWT